MRTALVIGAGIAGPVAAMALERVGVHAELHEAQPTGADTLGSWLTLQANGLDALAAVDAQHLVRDLGIPSATMRFTTGRGRPLGTMLNGHPLPDGTPSQLLRRADLYLALQAEARARGVEVHLGHRLVDVREDADGVEAVFADGGTARADLLVGADGIRSRVRDLIDPAAPTARYVPVLNTGGFVPPGAVPHRLDAPFDEMRMVFGRRCFGGWQPTADGGCVWFLNPPRRGEPARGELEAVPDAEWRARFADLLAGDTGPLRDVVAAQPGRLPVWATYDVPTLPHWHRDRLVVIGDAAHATSPGSGQGASLALEDAVLLARALGERWPGGSPAAASAHFEASRRERVEKVVAVGHRSSSSKATGPLGSAIRDLVLPLVFRRLAADGGASTAWITRHHVEPLPSTRRAG